MATDNEIRQRRVLDLADGIVAQHEEQAATSSMTNSIGHGLLNGLTSLGTVSGALLGTGLAAWLIGRREWRRGNTSRRGWKFG